MAVQILTQSFSLEQTGHPQQDKQQHQDSSKHALPSSSQPLRQHQHQHQHQHQQQQQQYQDVNGAHGRSNLATVQCRHDRETERRPNNLPGRVRASSITSSTSHAGATNELPQGSSHSGVYGGTNSTDDSWSVTNGSGHEGSRCTNTGRIEAIQGQCSERHANGDGPVAADLENGSEVRLQAVNVNGSSADEEERAALEDARVDGNAPEHPGEDTSTLLGECRWGTPEVGDPKEFYDPSAASPTNGDPGRVDSEEASASGAGAGAEARDRSTGMRRIVDARGKVPIKDVELTSLGTRCGAEGTCSTSEGTRQSGGQEMGGEEADEGIPSEYDSSRSTEANYRASHLIFTERFREARSQLDYSYHSNYAIERQKVQDRIIEAALGTSGRSRQCTPRGGAGPRQERRGGNESHREGRTAPSESALPTCDCSEQPDMEREREEDEERPAQRQRPWVVFTAGAMGAGKSHVMRLLGEHGLFPMEDFVQVDPDCLRRELPEMQAYLRRDPRTAGSLTHKEAGFMAEILEETALLEGRNILVDGSLRDGEWYAVHVKALRRRFPRLRVAIIHVWAPEKEVLARAAHRAAQTGRVIPTDTMLDTIRAVPTSVEKLAPLVDYCVRIDNSDWKSVGPSTASDASSRKTAAASEEGDSRVGRAQQSVSPPEERCRGVNLRQGSGRDGVEAAASFPGDGVQDELARLKDEENCVGGRKRSCEPVLPEDFPVLATAGETWGTFQDAFSSYKYPIIDDLRLRPPTIVPPRDNL